LESLAVVALPVAILSLFALCLRWACWREATACALIAVGALTVGITEILSPFELLRRGPVAVAWGVVTVAAALHMRRGRGRIGRPGGFDGAAILAIAAILGIVGFIAVLSPPNSTDAMAYHMPRVVYWAQAGSVRFFPTSYLNQIMLQPLAEYMMLHTYMLSGGDRFVNLVQWLGLAGSILGVSLAAKELGAGARGQTLAALFCATLPNAILQASGAKNDAALACWLSLMAYFALRWTRRLDWLSVAGAGVSLGLALGTKGTAYLFAPALLAGILAPVAWREGLRFVRAAPVAIALAAALNAPQYWRNMDLSGSPLGFDSAQGDGRYRWANERFGWRPAASNILRNLSEQLGARSPQWNEGVYRATLRIHDWLGIDPNDRVSTWPDATFAPPRNANHEVNAHNRWHLSIAVAAAAFLLWRWRKDRRLLCYLGGVALAFLLFCVYLKWQPFLARLELPLFVAAAPVVGTLGERIRPAILQAALCLLLVNNTRPYLFENWVRPLRGPRSLLSTERRLNYFSDLTAWSNRESYLAAVERTRASGCRTVGVDGSVNPIEYPYQALLRQTDPGIRFVHTGVRNASAKYVRAGATAPCAVLCLDCAGDNAKTAAYGGLHGLAIGRFVLFLDRVVP